MNNIPSINPLQPEEAAEEKQFEIFYSFRGSMRMTCPTGKAIGFISGKFVTQDQECIDYLKQEIGNKNPYIYQEEGKETITSEELDPMAGLRKRIIAEEAAKIVASAKAQLAATRELGNTESPEDIAKKAHIGNTALLEPKTAQQEIPEGFDQLDHAIGAAALDPKALAAQDPEARVARIAALKAKMTGLEAKPEVNSGAAIIEPAKVPLSL